MTRKELVKALDREFSINIRLRYSEDGYAVCVSRANEKNCITKLTPIKWSEIQCGHKEPRTYWNTRWDVRNAAPQCAVCNYSGKKYDPDFELFIHLHHGNVIEELYKKSRDPSKVSMTYMKNRYKELKAENKILLNNTY